MFSVQFVQYGTREKNERVTVREEHVLGSVYHNGWISHSSKLVRSCSLFGADEKSNRNQNLDLIGQKWRKIFLFFQGKAKGNKPALVVREYLQTFLFYLGWFIQRYFFIVLSFGTLIFILFGIGLIKIKIETNIEKLWVPRKFNLKYNQYRRFISRRISGGGRLEFERDFSKNIGKQRAIDNNWTVIEDKTGITDDSATNYQVLIQNTRHRGESLLTRDQLLLHSEILQSLSTFTVETNDK